MHKLVRTAASSTLYPKNSFIQTARYHRSSLDSRCIFDSERSLQVEFIFLNIFHTTFRHCRERSYPSFGQPFPKQLYIIPQGRTLEWQSPADRRRNPAINLPQRIQLPQDSAQIKARCSYLCFSLWDENVRQGAILACRSLKAFPSIAVERCVDSMFRAPTVWN